jgi:enamine deaminase RidA (YjgF/YER057c/UK114 family)
MSGISDSVRYINPKGASPAQGLYSHVGHVAAGPLYFVAGQLSVGENGSIVGKGDFDAQFHQVFQNLATVLEGLNARSDDIVKFTTYLVDCQSIERFMTLRAALFPKLFKGPLFPPNTLLIVNRLVKEEFLIEVESVVKAG